MRITPLILAPLVMLTIAPPVAAQTAPPGGTPSPAPQETPCRRIAVTWPTGPVEPGVAFDVAVSVVDDRGPTTFSVTRTAPGEPTFVRGPESSTSTVYTFTLSETTTLVVNGAQGSCVGDASQQSSSRTIEVRSQQGATPDPTASATASASPSAAPRVCPAIATSLRVGQPRPVTAGGQVEVPVTVGGLSATYTVSVGRQAPAPSAVVRNIVVAGRSTTVFTFRLGETHRLSVQATSTEPCWRDERTVADVNAPVRAAVNVAATRVTTREYVFTGRVQPADGTVSLYRVESDGRRVLTARAAVARDGAYRISRRFTGSGRFGFVAVAHPAARHAGGTSTVRPTDIH